MLIDRRPFVAAMLFMVPAALLAAGKFPYMFLYLTTLAVLIPYWRLTRSLRNLRGEITVSSRTREVGQSFEVNYRIINSETGAFPYLELAHGATSLVHDSPYIALRPGAHKEIRREILCRRRGVYDLKSLTVKTGDPFGLFQLEKPLADGGVVKVYPRIRHFPGINLPTNQHVGDRTTKNTAYENHSEIKGLREWQDGDMLKSIHWKQSAKHEKLIVKKYEHTADAEFTLFVDMHQESYGHDLEHQLEDLAVELAASLVYYRLRDNLSLLLFSDSILDSPLKGRRLRDYVTIVDHMIALAPKQTGSFFTYLRKQSYALRANASLYLITPSLTLTDADLLLSLKRKGFSLVLFYLCLKDVNAGIERILIRMREAGIRVHVLYTSGETNNDSRL